jgi:uncharacterized protein
MERISLFLAIIASLFVLCQWFVYTSLRSYLFQRYGDISRETAYCVLIALGVFNVIAVRLAFDADTPAADAQAKLWVSVAYFSFLGYVLLLSIIFGFLRLASGLLSLKDVFVSALGTIRNQSDSLQSEKGCLSSFGGGEERESVLRDQQDSAGQHECFCRERQPSLENGLHRPTSESAAPTRRAFLKWTAATGVVVAAAAAGHGVAEGYERPLVEKFDFFHDMLNSSSRPITVIQVTDFHFGLFLGIPQLEKLVDDLNSMAGDALFLTGDVFHSPMSPVEIATPTLKKLKPRRFGNFVVMGNHDFYAGEWRSVESFKQSGLILLRNRWVTFDDGDCQIHIGGIDDPMVNWLWGTKFPEFDQFMKNCPKSKGIRILLSHRPAVFPQATRAGIDLVLAGHIHGGQIILPAPGDERGVSLANLVSDYTHGWYKNGAGRMYLNRGVGLTFVPWRINCPPEIAVFQLKPTQGRIASGEAIRV